MVTESGPFVLLDIGATTNSTGEQLYQFAEMGALFAEQVLGVERPRVALLSIGEETGKGDARIQRATELLQASSLNFIGNVEGKDLVTHMADVVVCDAVVGNVVIKFFEGLSQFIFGLLRKEFERLPFGPPRLPADAARHPPDPQDLRLRGLGRVAPARGQGHRDHHPRPGQAPDDLVRRGGRGGCRPGRDPRGDRRDVPADARRLPPP